MAEREQTRTTSENPVGTDGFEFIEFAAPEPAELGRVFEQMGFTLTARHRSKNALLYQQGEINFIVNAEPRSFGERFAKLHGPCICAIAFRVRDAAVAYERALDFGAWGVEGRVGPMELNIPAIKGIGDSLLYLVDRYGERGNIYDVDFVPVDPPRAKRVDFGLGEIDHITHNLHRGRMSEWAEFYEQLFGFREIRRFDIQGRATGLVSKAMVSPCGKIRIPLNESSDDQSQIQEYLEAYRGEGIQHVALHTQDIFGSVEALRGRGVRLLETPDTYYDAVDERVPDHGEDTKQLRDAQILIDGNQTPGDGTLLQIFTETMIGPIFFEIIQRKGNEGFGEGNFQALFEAMEADQIRRGVLKV